MIKHLRLMLPKSVIIWLTILLEDSVILFISHNSGMLNLFLLCLSVYSGMMFIMSGDNCEM